MNTFILVACTILALGTGCVAHRGHWSSSPATVSEHATVSLVALGGLFGGRHMRRTAAELAGLLQREKATGRTVVLLWLGDLGRAHRRGGRCRPPDQIWGRSSMGQMAAVARQHTSSGGASYAVHGRDDWRCSGTSGTGEPEDEASRGLWHHPAANFVVRIESGERAAVVSACSTWGPCVIEPSRTSAGTELVFLDVTPWSYPEAVSAHKDAAAASLHEQAQLLLALDRAAPATRILVSSAAVESGGTHGSGGIRASVGYRRLPLPLRRAIARGMFVGAIGGHDPALQVAADASDAIRRASRIWIHAPLFQVVSAAASRPESNGIRMLDRLPRRRGVTLAPDLATTAAGFARITLSPTTVDLVLHRRGAWSWQQAAVRVPIPRPVHPTEGPAPAMAPCLRCEPRPSPNSTEAE
ncbi:MAG: hypothetical protein V3V08_20880 [Nannocystaceae bacterium]